MTTSGVYKTRNVRSRPESARWDFEFLMTLKGTPWNPNPAAGDMAAGSSDASTSTSSSGRGGGFTGGSCSEQSVHQECRCAEVRIQHELPWLVMTNTTARAHTEERRKRLESCLAEDEETKFRSEAAKLCVDNCMAEKPRSSDAVSHEPSGAASSSAPPAAASGSVPMAVSSSS